MSLTDGEVQITMPEKNMYMARALPFAAHEQHEDTRMMLGLRYKRAVFGKCPGSLERYGCHEIPRYLNPT